MKATCDISNALKSKTKGKYLYSCYSASFVSQYSFRLGSYTKDLNELYLELPAGANFTSYESLSRGFILRSSRIQENANFVFDYTTPFSRLRKATYDMTSDYFPYSFLFYMLTFQLLVLGLMSMVLDKRRLPMYSLYILALGYIPIFAIIRRGTLARENAGFNCLYRF